ncbi:hypothetical protein RUM44_012112 [Polyplax serrata]|uniref:Tubulin beta chain n=1 Tax=Polyplax serrata TaxID=468196 RepID=A0ABR1BFA2_POLSC
MISQEHGINETGAFMGGGKSELERINVFYTETKGLNFTPRSLMIDLDKSSMDTFRSSQYGGLFRSDNFLFGNEGAGNNWAKGHFTEGAELCDRSLRSIRKEAENCDCLSGFQMLHALGGGTGSGLGSLLISKMTDEYPSRLITNYSIFPSPIVCNSVVEPYNAILTLNHLIEYSRETYCMDNEALNGVLAKTLKLSKSSLKDLNYIVAMVIAGTTSCLRFPGLSNIDYRKIAVNMIPYPRLHFFLPGYSPITSRGSVSYRKLTVQEMANQIFDPKNIFADCNVQNGMYLTVACIMRGDISTKEVDKQMYIMQNKNSPYFVEWIPDNVKTAICSIPPKGHHTSATFIANNTSLREVFKKIREKFLIMFKRRAFLHWYTGEGMEELEFENADANVNDLISEFLDKENLNRTKQKSEN